MSPLQILTSSLALIALSSSAWAQEAEPPPIDPYADSEAGNQDSGAVDEGTEAEPIDPALQPSVRPSPTPSMEEPAAEKNDLPAYPVIAQPVPALVLERSGLMGGLALGFGSLGAGGESDGTLNYTLSFGGYLSNSLALLVDLWGGRVQDDEFHINNSKQGVSALYWLNSSLWAKASLASASYTSYVGDVMLSEFSGIAVGAGLGWEFFSRGSFHLDARLSLSIEGYKNSRDNVSATAIQIGLHYF